jgi:hypothetical protein
MLNISTKRNDGVRGAPASVRAGEQQLKLGPKLKLARKQDLLSTFADQLSQCQFSPRSGCMTLASPAAINQVKQ